MAFLERCGLRHTIDDKLVSEDSEEYLTIPHVCIKIVLYDHYTAQPWQGLTHIFFDTIPYYVQIAQAPIQQLVRCSYEDIHLRQHSFHITEHMAFSTHHEMNRVARGDVPLSEQNSRKPVYRAGNTFKYY